MVANSPNTLTWSFHPGRKLSEMWDLQESLRARIIEGKAAGHLFLVEHPPTISLGRAEKGTNLLWDKKDLAQKGFDVVEINRGGLVTYHGPGQLVAYPVVNLRDFGPGVKNFVRGLEKAMMSCLDHFGMEASRHTGYPGTWVGRKKIGSIGIHVRKQVSIHGLALNVCPDLSHFSVITPCGIANVVMTSMQEEGVDTSVSAMVETFVDSFSQAFACSMEKISTTSREVPPLQEMALHV